VARDDDVAVLQHVVRRVTDDIARHADLVVGVLIHEHVVDAVVVEVGHLATVHVRGVHLHPGVEGLVDHLAGEDVLQGGAHEGTALAGLDVLEVHDGPELAVDVEHQSVLEVVRGSHGRGLLC
jgi:hypothetical protein